MLEAKKYLQRSLLIFLGVIYAGVYIELELEYLSPIIIYLGLVNLGYSILILMNKSNDEKTSL